MSQVELDREVIEKELCLIADIEAARIVFNGSDSVEELHEDHEIRHALDFKIQGFIGGRKPGSKSVKGKSPSL